MNRPAIASGLSWIQEWARARDCPPPLSPEGALDLLLDTHNPPPFADVIPAYIDCSLCSVASPTPFMVRLEEHGRATWYCAECSRLRVQTEAAIRAGAAVGAAVALQP